MFIEESSVTDITDQQKKAVWKRFHSMCTVIGISVEEFLTSDIYIICNGANLREGVQEICAEYSHFYIVSDGEPYLFSLTVSHKNEETKRFLNAARREIKNCLNRTGKLFSLSDENPEEGTRGRDLGSCPSRSNLKRMRTGSSFWVGIQLGKDEPEKLIALFRDIYTTLKKGKKSPMEVFLACVPSHQEERENNIKNISKTDRGRAGEFFRKLCDEGFITYDDKYFKNLALTQEGKKFFNLK